ncbi:BTB/POZ domain-containing protein, partial [Camellia lanceoleosa]
ALGFEPSNTYTDSPAQWEKFWVVTLGFEHSNTYTDSLAQCVNTAFTYHFSRIWGSLDGKTWTNLRVHENDQTMCKLGQYASWPIIGPNALLPFRFFRGYID